MMKRELEGLVARLSIQRRRLLTAAKKEGRRSSTSYTHHDMDYYLILARRLYRLVQNLAKEDSKTANIKGKKEYRNLYKKLKMRDHSEHPPRDFSKFPSITLGSPIKAIHSIAVSNGKVVIFSGDQTWDMDEDDTRLVGLVREVITKLSEAYYKDIEEKLGKITTVQNSSK